MRKGIDYPGVTLVFFCHDGHGNYVLNKRSVNCRDEHGRWDPGAGSLDLGETVADALQREIAEEYCTDVIAHEFLGYRDIHREHDGQATHWVGLIFRVQVDRSKVKIGEPHKHDDLQWYRMDALPTPLHSQFEVVLREFGEKLV